MNRRRSYQRVTNDGSMLRSCHALGGLVMTLLILSALASLNSDFCIAAFGETSMEVTMTGGDLATMGSRSEDRSQSCPPKRDRVELVTGELAGVGPGMRIGLTNGKIVWGGILKVKIPLEATILTDAYCIDLAKLISIGNDFITDGPTSPEINYILNLPWPPGPVTNLEAASRQAAIWRYSDNATVGSANPELARRTQEIIDEAAGADDIYDPPDLEITPAYTAVTLEEASISYTVYASQDGFPAEGIVVHLATSFGDLSADQVITNQDGIAQFSVTNSLHTPGIATIDAAADFQFDRGVILERTNQPNNQQKLVLAQPVTGSVITQVVGQWVNNGTIVVHKWADYDCNTIQNDEPSLPNWPFNLYRDGTFVARKITDSSGNASFTNLPPANYTVIEGLTPGWMNITPDFGSTTPSMDIRLNAGECEVAYFGNLQLGAIRIKKFFDENLNGNWDNQDEPLLDGFTFILSDASTGAVRGVGVTVSGVYVFSGLTPGNYILQELAQPDWFSTTELPLEITVTSTSYHELEVGNAMSMFTPTAVFTPTATPIVATPSPTIPPDQIWVSDSEGCTGNLVMVSIFIENDLTDIGEFSFSLVYKPSALNFLMGDRGELVSPQDGINFVAETEESVAIAANLTTKIPAGSKGELAVLFFKVTCEECLEGDISPLEVTNPALDVVGFSSLPGSFTFTCGPSEPPTPTDPNHCLAEFAAVDDKCLAIFPILDRDHAEMGLLQGDRMDPPLTLLSLDTYPVLEGTICDMFIVKIYPGIDQLNDILVLTKGGNYPNGLILLYRNANGDDYNHSLLQYRFVAAVPADAALPYDEDTVTIEPVFVRALDVDKDIWNRKEVMVFFNVLLANGTTEIRAVVYPNVASNPNQFQFGWAGLPEYYFELAQPGRLLDVKVGNLNAEPMISDRDLADDFILLMAPESPSDAPVHCITSKGGTNGFTSLTQIRLPMNQQPNSLAIGEFHRFADQLTLEYPEAVLATVTGQIYIFANNIARSHYTNPFSLSERLRIPADITGIQAGNLFAQFDANDLVFLAANYTGGTGGGSGLVRFNHTTLMGKQETLQDTTIFTNPSISVEGRITAPDGTCDTVIISDDRAYIGLQLDDPASGYGHIYFDPQRPEKVIQMPGRIIRAEFTQYVAGSPRP